MRLNKLRSDLTRQLGNAYISTTQLLSERRWIRTPDLTTAVLGDGEHRYRIHRDWCKADPATHPVNNCHEMVIDRAGHLLLLTDHPRNNILVFDPEGNVVDSWTLGFDTAHGLTLAREGNEEFLWICDPGSGQVVKTTLLGEVIQRLASPHSQKVYNTFDLFQPTETAVASNGDIYVADGYGSQFVLQYARNGDFIRKFGGKGKTNASLDFAHGVAIDDRLGAGKETLLVTSRRASCIKRFTLDGTWLSDIPLPGGYPCRAVIHADYLMAGLCWSGAHLRMNSGFVVMLDRNDRVCATPGGHAKWDDQGKLARLVSDYSCFQHVHDVCRDKQGNLYACQWNAGHSYPIKLEHAPA